MIILQFIFYFGVNNLFNVFFGLTKFSKSYNLIYKKNIFSVFKKRKMR